MNQLARETSAHVRRLADAGRPIDAALVAAGVAHEHRGGLANADGAAFWRVGTFLYLRDAARRCINALQAPAGHGFRRLQGFYLVRRDDCDLGLPVQMLSDDELRARAEELDRMAVGARAHAREIREYLASRVSPVAA